MRAGLLRLIGEGHRLFFLGAGGFALVAILWWEAYLGVHFTGGMVTRLPFAMPPHQWHAHELVFGYGGAVLAGFLLTTLPGEPLRRRRVVALAGLMWLAGRLALWSSGGLSPVLVALADLSLGALLWGRLAHAFAARRNPRLAVLAGFVALFWLANLSMHLGWADLWPGGAATGARAGLLALAGLILVVGGQLVPGLVRNHLHRQGLDEAALPRDPAYAAPVMLALGLGVAASALVAPFSPLSAALALIAGGAHLARQAHWAPHRAFGAARLAAPQLAMALVGAGLVLVGLSGFVAFSEIAALHLLGIGGFGGMSFAVMAHVATTRAGRAEEAPGALLAAQALILLAALSRLAGSALAGAVYFPATLLAGALWILGFALFLALLWPALWEPRLPRAASGAAPD